MKFSFILLFVLLFSATASATEFKFLDEPLIYKDPLAYPRNPNNISLTINSAELFGQKVMYFNGTIGKTIPLITMINQDLKLQFSVEAATWITLGYDAGMFPLLTQDFVIAAPLSFRYKGFSGAIKYNHISAHLGDGMNGYMKNHLPRPERERIEQEQINVGNSYVIKIINNMPYSRNFTSIHGAYDFAVDNVDIKYYAQAGYVDKMIPSNLMRYFIGNGTEFKINYSTFSPYLAEDITWYADVKDAGFSAQLGGYIKERTENLFNVRVAITMYRGCDRRGQLVGKKLEEFGFGIFIQ